MTFSRSIGFKGVGNGDEHKMFAKTLSDGVAETACSVAKRAICVVGALFQAAKTFLEISFLPICIPCAFLYESGAVKDLCNRVAKDAIMTAYLTHFVFKGEYDNSSAKGEYDNSSAKGEYDNSSAKEILKNTFAIVVGFHESYDSDVNELWEQGAQSWATDTFL